MLRIIARESRGSRAHAAGLGNKSPPQQNQACRRGCQPVKDRQGYVPTMEISRCRDVENVQWDKRGGPVDPGRTVTIQGMQPKSTFAMQSVLADEATLEATSVTGVANSPGRPDGPRHVGSPRTPLASEDSGKMCLLPSSVAGRIRREQWGSVRRPISLFCCLAISALA